MLILNAASFAVSFGCVWAISLPPEPVSEAPERAGGVLFVLGGAVAIAPMRSKESPAAVAQDELAQDDVAGETGTAGAEPQAAVTEAGGKGPAG